MRSIPAAALGSYYTTNSDPMAANVWEMRNLVWMAKNNRGRPPFDVMHPRHPIQSIHRIRTPGDAYSYCADLAGALRGEFRKAFGFGIFPRLALVPIPASGTTKKTMASERWPAREMANAFEAQRLGTVRANVVRRIAVQPKHRSSRVPPEEMVENLEVITEIPANEHVVLIDDVITWGDSVVAMDAVLGGRARGAIAIGFTTDGGATLDGLGVRYQTVRYDRSFKPWAVEVVPS